MRWAMAVMFPPCSICVTRSKVRWRDSRPPRYVTETNEGSSGSSSLSVAVSTALSSSDFGGKNSNDLVVPCASSASMRTKLAGSSEVVLETNDVVFAEVRTGLDFNEDHGL